MQSVGYARLKFLNGFIFIALGAVLVAELLRGVGVRFEALPGYVLGAAFVGLGIVRLRTGWPRR